MSAMTRFFASRWGIILAGTAIGVLAPLLQYLGNPKNMGICVACFERDIAGALGLHRAAVVQYIRPEIIGFVLGALVAAYLFREFRARAGSAPIVRFVLGAFAMIGALVFLGCPWRAGFRLAGGDLTGGANGLPVNAPEIMGYSFDTDSKIFYLILLVTVLCVLVVTNVIRTRPGRAFVAIRDYHQSAENVGVNLFAFKLQAFGMSSFLAGVAGGLWAHYTLYITPEQFSMGLSISYLAMIIIGGMGSVLGSIFGAIFITLLPELLNLLISSLGGMAPDLSAVIVPMKEGVFGLMLVLFLIFEPEGLARKWRLTKAYWKLYPFAY